MSRSRKAKSKDRPKIDLGAALVSWGARLVVLIVIIIVVLTLAQCTVKKPDAPSWNTHLTIPLVSRTYQMAEIVRKIDQDGIYMNADSDIVYSFSRDLDTFAIDADHLTTDGVATDIAGVLGAVTLDPPSITPMTTNIAALSGLPGVYPAVVPASSFDVPVVFPALSDLTSADVVQGQCYFVVSNNLDLDIDAATVTLGDLGLGRTLAIEAFPAGILAGESDSVLISLDSQSISNRFGATVSCHTPGGIVSGSSGREITCAVHFVGDLRVSTAVAAVPALTRDYSNDVSLQESDVITSAAIADGSLQLTISNNTPLPSDVVITVPDLQRNGSPLVIAHTVPANSTASVTSDLTGYNLDPADGTTPQTMPVDVQVSLAGSNGSLITISETNSFDVVASLSTLRFSSVTGIFNNLTATISPVVRDLEIPKGFDSLQLTHVVATLEIENSLSVPGTLNLTLTGNNGKDMDMGGAINARSLATAATTVLVEPNAESFLAPLPSQVTISGTASFGSGVSGTIREGDYLTGRITLEAPLELVIKETPIEADVERQKIDQKDIDQITDHVTEARFVYNLINHLPVGATVNIVLSPDSATLYSNPQLRFDSLSVEAAPVSASVVTDTLSTGYQTLSISNEDVQILKNDTLFVGYEVVLHGSHGQPVRLTKNDFYSLIGRIEVEYLIDGNM